MLGFGGAALASTEQVDRGAQFEKGVGGGLNAVDARNGIEDDPLLLHEAVFEYSGKFERTEFYEFAGFGPVDGCIVGDVAGGGHLNEDLESDGGLLDAMFEFFVVIVGAKACDLGVAEIVISSLGNNAVAAVLDFTLGVDKAEGRHAEVGVAGKARRERLGSLHETERGRMRPQ